MEKVLTISIAAYNVEEYIEKTLDSLLIKNMELLEVLIIVDGSKDRTLDIAKKYEEKYPNTFKAIYKENGGYGSTINTGINYATGKYFKQLDGDDWYDTQNLNKICLELQEVDTDIVYTQYIEYKEKSKKQIIRRSKIENVIKEEKLENAIKYVDDNLFMYFLMYKTKLLKENNISLEEHCFYTDSQYAIYPLFYGKSIKIFDIPLYVYRVGREGQSVSTTGKLKHYQDHIRNDQNLLDKSKELNMVTENIREYIEDFMARTFASCIGNYLILLKPNKENFARIQEYDNNILNTNKEIYKKMSEYSKMVKLIRQNNIYTYKVGFFIKRIKLMLERII